MKIGHRGKPAKHRTSGKFVIQENDHPAAPAPRSEIVAGSAPNTESATDMARALHELAVHQIELEATNAELRKARDELEAALEKYTDLYDFTPVGCVSIDESGVILEANLTGAALLGAERSWLVRRRLSLFVNPASRLDFTAFLKGIFNGNGSQACETILLGAGGVAFWAGLRATLAVSPPGRGRWCRVAFEDITGRKKVEETLRESEKRYRALFDLFPVAVYSCDSSGVIQKFNRMAAELWGREPAVGEKGERFCGSVKLFRPDGRFLPHGQCPMAETVNGKIPAVHDEEVLIERTDGSRISALVNIRPLKNEWGEITGAINCFYDITGRKRAEEVLRRNERLFSALLAQAPVGVYVVDANLRLQQVNPKARVVFAKIRPLIGRDFAEILRVIWPKRVAEFILERFRGTLKTGEPYRSPDFAERRRDSGARQIYEWQIQRVTLPAGEFGVVCFFRNITGRKRAEGARRRLAVLTASNRKLEREIARRRAAQDSLKESERHQSLLLKESRKMQAGLRNLSHQVLRAQEEERKHISRELHDEIAQTLVGINVHLATLIRETAGNPEGLTEKIQRTQRLVEQSVDVVHQFARQLRPIGLEDLGLVAALHAFMKDYSKRTGIHIQFKTFTAGKVDELDNAASIVFYRVAQEALANVARHAEASLIEVVFEKIPGAISLRIKDNGKSFPARHVMRSKQNRRLGLIGMRERLEMVGGNFSVESAPGEGTTVSARIPLVGGRAGNGNGGKSRSRRDLGSARS